MNPDFESYICETQENKLNALVDDFQRELELLDKKEVPKRGLEGETSTPAKKPRQTFTEKQVLILNNFLAQSIENPYPTEEEKIMLENETQLTRKQIDSWFTNARKRRVSKLRQTIPPHIKQLHMFEQAVQQRLDDKKNLH